MNPHLKSVMRTEPYAAYIGRRPTEVVLRDLESRAILSKSTQTWISQSTRIDCAYNVRTAGWEFLVNGRPCDREHAAEAVDDAREHWVRAYGM